MSLFEKIQEAKKQQQQREAVKAIKQQSSKNDKSKDKSYLKNCFTKPGAAQIQMMLNIGDLPIEASNIEPIIEGLLERLQETKEGNWDSIELTLHAQINMLAALSTHLLAKSVGGYSDANVMATIPQVPGELARLGLQCASEMRKCMTALHQLKTPRKTQFIKTQQLNQLLVQQQELTARLEAASNHAVDTGSKAEAIGSYQEVAAVETVNGTKNGRGEGG